MAVLNNLRNLSEMEFYKNAIKMRVNLTNWLLRDFGTKRNPRSVTKVIKNIDEEDQNTIDEIFAKYGKSPKHEFQSEYPKWFVEYERKVIVELLQELVENITSANSIYPSKDFLHEEYAERRRFQNKAICNCYTLYQELQYITACFGTDLNKFIPFLDSVEKEVDLLKGWRQSDNAKRKKMEKEKSNS
jgi:hypothetical protein